MLYHATRNGQTYGPYTLDDLRRYVASGNVLPTDLAKSDDMAEWLPVAQVLGTVTPPVAAGPYAGSPVYPQTSLAAYPDPPNLSWGLVALFTIFTFGLFMVVWNIVVAAWMRRVQPTSQALLYYIAGTILVLVNSGASVGFLLAMQHHHIYQRHPYSFFLGIAGWVVRLIARLTMKADLERHFNGPEPIGLRLSGSMTFFFGGLYHQYHLNRINEIKAAARYQTVLR